MDKEQIEKLRKVCKNLTILYVEDDKDISENVEKLIKKIFVHVDIEKNGLNGLETYTDKRHDIVITDISMPIMDGIEMIRNIKLLNSEQNIIVTSAHNDAEYLIKLIEMGIDKFIMKPININLFLSSLSKIAVGVYRAKREEHVEKIEKKYHEFKIELLDSILFPLAYFKDNELFYANEIFREQFFTAIDKDDITRFRLGYILEDKKFISMSNSGVVNAIENSSEKIFGLMDVKKQLIKKYHANVNRFKKTNESMVCFVSLDMVNTKLNRYIAQIDYFPKREAFKHAVFEMRNKLLEPTAILCAGLKNTQAFKQKFGGAKMHSAYSNLAKFLKKEFEEEVASKKLSIYLFETNRYIFLAHPKYVESIESKIDNFGHKYSFEYGSTLSFEMETTKVFFEKTDSLDMIMEKAEGMLYTFG